MKENMNQTTVETETHRIQVSRYGINYEVVFEGTIELAALADCIEQYEANRYQGAWLSTDGITIRQIQPTRTLRIDWPPLPRLEPVQIVPWDSAAQEAAREARRLATIQDNEAL